MPETFSDKHRRDKLPTSVQHSLDKCAKQELYGSKAVASDFTDVTEVGKVVQLDPTFTLPCLFNCFFALSFEPVYHCIALVFCSSGIFRITEPCDISTTWFIRVCSCL